MNGMRSHEVGKDVVKCRWMWWRLGLEMIERKWMIVGRETESELKS